jgi:hypothetical protein
MGEDARDRLAREAARRWPRPWQDAITESMARTDFVGTPVAEYVPDQLVNGRMASSAAHCPPR